MDYKYNQVIDKTIVEIFTGADEDGVVKKWIHFCAYGYFCEDAPDPKRDHRFVEYTFFMVPLKEVLDFGVSEYESEEGCRYKQYIDDVSEDQMVANYNHYDNGKQPKLLHKEDINIDTPDGFYILI